MSIFEQKRQAMIEIVANKYNISEEIVGVASQIPRELFVYPTLQPMAYMNTLLNALKGRTLLSPFTTIQMINLLNIKIGDNVLVIAPAYGYSSTILAMLGAGRVYTMEDKSLKPSLAVEAFWQSNNITIFNHNIDFLKEMWKLEKPLYKFPKVLIEGSLTEIPEKILAHVLEDQADIIFIKRTEHPRSNVINHVKYEDGNFTYTDYNKVKALPLRIDLE